MSDVRWQNNETVKILNVNSSLFYFIVFQPNHCFILQGRAWQLFVTPGHCFQYSPHQKWQISHPFSHHTPESQAACTYTGHWSPSPKAMEKNKFCGKGKCTRAAGRAAEGCATQRMGGTAPLPALDPLGCPSPDQTFVGHVQSPTVNCCSKTLPLSYLPTVHSAVLQFKYSAV